MLIKCSTYVNPDEFEFVRNTKNQMLNDGFNNISQSKIIRYAVMKLEDEEYNTIVANMQENSII